MTTADAQLRRLLALLPHLADGKEHGIAKVADTLGVSPDTVTSDLESLTNRFGDPPGWIENVSVYLEPERVSVTAPHFKRPMRFAPAETQALLLGLSLLRVEAAPERIAEVEAVADKVRRMSVRAQDGEEASEDSAVSSGTRRQLEHVPRLRQALKQRRRVAVNYRKSGSDAAERRVICPFTFAVEKGAWYLVAQCERREGIRIFRLDRIESIELLAETFEVPADVDVDALLARHTAFIGEPPQTLRIRYSPRVARWIAEREQGATNADGSFEVEYPLADVEWAVRHVLQYGPEAEVLAPDGARQAVVRALRAALAANQ